MTSLVNDDITNNDNKDDINNNDKGIAFGIEYNNNNNDPHPEIKVTKHILGKIKVVKVKSKSSPAVSPFLSDICGDKINLTTKERANALIQIKAYMIKKKLDTTVMSTVIRGKSKHAPGNDGATEGTLQRYRPVWNQLLDFCILMEDWQSCIILWRDICPRNPYPVNVDTARIFLLYKTQKTGTILEHPDTNLPVQWVSGSNAGKKIVNDGTWQSLSAVHIFGAALRKLHDNDLITQDNYIEECSLCLSNSIHGCEMHRGFPHIRSKGNVCNSVKFKKSQKIIGDWVVETYESRHTQPLFPKQLRQLRHYLLAKNRKDCMMLWTIILVSTCQCLRIDECLSLTYQQFLSKYFLIRKNSVDSLLMVIKGKTDKKNVHFNVWDRHTCAEFSAVRLILTWISMSNIKTGYIFPSRHFVYNNKDNNIPAPSHYPYLNFIRDLKYLCYGVLNLSTADDRIMGTHMFRKSYFLLCCWGQYNDEFSRGLLRNVKDESGLFKASLMLDGRHESVVSTKIYMTGAESLRVMIDRFGGNNPEQFAPVYLPIYVDDLVVGINKYKFYNNGYSMLEIMSKVTDYTPPKYTNQIGEKNSIDVEGLLTLLQGFKLDSDKVTEVMKFVNTISDDKASTAANKMSEHIYRTTAIDDSGLTTPLINNKPAPAEPSSIVVLPSFNIDNNFQKRFGSIGKNNVAERLDIIIMGVKDAQQQIMCGAGTIPDGYRRWLYHVGQMTLCIENCYGGCNNKFLAERTQLLSSTFVCSKGKKHKFTIKRPSKNNKLETGKTKYV